MYDGRLLGQGSPDAVNAGRRARVELRNNVRNFYLDILLEAVVDITVAGAALRNRGSILALFDKIGIFEGGGKEVISYDARTLKVIAQAFAPTPLTGTRLSGVGVATTTVREWVRLYFSWPTTSNPADTAYIEANPSQKLGVFFDYNGNIANLSSGAPTATITGVTIRVYQFGDLNRDDRPGWLPRVSEVVTPIAVANTNQKIPLSLDGTWLAALVIQQDSSAGEVTDIFTGVNGLRLENDLDEIITPQVPFVDLQRFQEYDFGGNLLANAPAYLVLNFVKNGRLSQAMRADKNLRILANVAVSASAGGVLRVTQIGLVRPQGLVKDVLGYDA